jgi:hypothetical protein
MFQLTGDREGVVLIYVDSTQGWLPISGINEGTDALAPAPYSIDFLVVAGGGGGGMEMVEEEVEVLVVIEHLLNQLHQQQ